MRCTRGGAARTSNMAYSPSIDVKPQKGHSIESSSFAIVDEVDATRRNQSQRTAAANVGLCGY
jgi:hypothetical protein